MQINGITKLELHIKYENGIFANNEDDIEKRRD